MSKFNKAALLRILGKVDRDMAVDVILELEEKFKIHSGNELLQLAHISISRFFGGVPDFLIRAVEKVYPEFRTQLILFVALIFRRYLSLRRGQNLDLSFDEQVFVMSEEEFLEYLQEEREIEIEETSEPDEDLNERIQKLEDDLNEIMAETEQLKADKLALQDKINAFQEAEQEEMLCRSNAQNLYKLLLDRERSVDRKIEPYLTDPSRGSVYWHLAGQKDVYEYVIEKFNSYFNLEEI